VPELCAAQAELASSRDSSTIPRRAHERSLGQWRDESRRRHSPCVRTAPVSLHFRSFFFLSFFFFSFLFSFFFFVVVTRPRFDDTRPNYLIPPERVDAFLASRLKSARSKHKLLGRDTGFLRTITMIDDVEQRGARSIRDTLINLFGPPARADEQTTFPSSRLLPIHLHPRETLISYSLIS